MQSFSSDGVRIAFIDERPAAGAGESVLLIHGFASTHAINWVNTHWVKTLTEAGRRVIALDNRGHGRSDKPHDPAAYHSDVMAEDARRLLDHLEIPRADVMGYSMGARITAHLALRAPERVRSIMLGGLGIHLVEGVGLPVGVANAMEAPSAEAVADPLARGFRVFADRNGQDLAAMAACIRGSRQVLSRAEVGRIAVPALICVGTEDGVAGSPHELAALMQTARAVDIPRRDHNLAVGDKLHKQAVVAFLAERA